jgi:hypothetical protein
MGCNVGTAVAALSSATPVVVVGAEIAAAPASSSNDSTPDASGATLTAVHGPMWADACIHHEVLTHIVSGAAAAGRAARCERSTAALAEIVAWSVDARARVLEE